MLLNKTQLKPIKLSLVVFCLFCFLFLGGKVFANPSSGITVSPANITISVSNKNPNSEEVVSIRNNFDTTIRLNAGMYGVDIQDGRLTPTSEPSKELSDVVTLSQTDITLQPKQSINIKMLVRNNDKLSPGGHYGSLLIKQVTDSQKSIGLQPAINVITYVVKEDGAIRKLELKDPQLPKIMFRLPDSTSLTLANKGNIAVIPRAVISFVNGNKVYAKTVINEGSLPIFPENELSFKGDFQKTQQSWLPGIYMYLAQYRYNGDPQQSVFSKKILVVPYQFIIFTVTVLVVIYLCRKRIKKILLKLKNKSKSVKKPKTKESPKAMDIIAPKNKQKNSPKA